MKYPPWNTTPSMGDKRKYYENMREEIANHRQGAINSDIIARQYRLKADEATSEKKVTDKKILHLTKKQKAIEEGKKAGYWSGAAAISVTILYETWKVAGFPGGKQWESWWHHEAVYGVLMWFVTLMFGWFYRATQGD